MRILGFLGLLVLGIFGMMFPQPSQAAVDLSVSLDLFAPPPVAIAPPPLPIYVVPAAPTPGLIWAPGHWRWGGYGYFWVPGTWVQPPMAGVLWTPGYWGWQNGVFAWHEGYWGPHVGFYGGVNYGGGYAGAGFVGGGWDHGVYNVNHAYINVPNIAGNVGVTASFNGGPGGTVAVISPQEQAFVSERHIPPTQEQIAHAQAASRNPALAASANHGKPAIAATLHAGNFTRGVIQARQAGARNLVAEQHNAQVRNNPALAHGAAMPHGPLPGNRGIRPQPPHPEPHPEPHSEGHHPEGEEYHEHE